MDYQQFQNIIYRYFRGQLSDSEYELLTDSLQDESYREYFEKAKLAWESQPELDDELGTQNLSRLQYKINQKDLSKPKEPNIRQLWVRVASVAAILIFGLLLGGTVTYLFSPAIKSTEQLVFRNSKGRKIDGEIA